jgi:hypothetical protein
MARIARFVVPGLPHHVTQRGNRRETVFFSDADYELYRDLLGQQCRKHGVAVWSYCLMPNHVHLILVPDRAEALGRALGETVAPDTIDHIIEKAHRIVDSQLEPKHKSFLEDDSNQTKHQGPFARRGGSASTGRLPINPSCGAFSLASAGGRVSFLLASVIVRRITKAAVRPHSAAGATINGAALQPKCCAHAPRATGPAN